MNRRSINRGFTLIEMIIVITVLAILGTMSVVFIRYTFEGYAAQTRRAALVDETTLSLNRMARDIRSALPNSVRVNASKHAIEILHVCAAGRYRAGPGKSGSQTYTDPQFWLKFNESDDQFNVLGMSGSCAGASIHAVIYNLGIAGANAYAIDGSPNVITPTGTTITFDTSGLETQVTLSSAFQFQYRSPANRIYFVNTPISWVCAPDTGTLKRYSGYTINATQTVPVTQFGALANADVSACQFEYHAGTAQRAGVATLQLTLTRAGESAHLLEQVHVINAP